MIGIDHDALFLAADAWKLFVGLEHRAGLGVVQNECPIFYYKVTGAFRQGVVFNWLSRAMHSYGSITLLI